MSRRHVAAALGLPAVPALQAQDWGPGKGRVDGLIRCGPLLVLGGIGGGYPNRRPDGPGDARQHTADALTIMNERGLQQVFARATAGALVLRRHLVPTPGPAAPDRLHRVEGMRSEAE